MGKVLSSLVLAVLMGSIIHVVHCSSGEIDGTAVVTRVHDGDTFYIDRDFYGSNTIRLADINTPELGEPKSIEAKDFLEELIYLKAVQLDIDDNDVFDFYGTGHRLICVTYVNHNSTHYKNVNEALLDANLAEEDDYGNNEFNPDSWTLYVPKQEIPEFSSLLILPLFMLSTLMTIMVYRGKQRRQQASEDTGVRNPSFNNRGFFQTYRFFDRYRGVSG